MPLDEAVAGFECTPRERRFYVPTGSLMPLCQRVRLGHFLFREGDARKSVFKIEEGKIAVFRNQVGRPSRIFRIAVPGDFVGLGCFECHSENAQCISDCVVRRLTREEFVALAEIAPDLKQIQCEAIEQEFESRKEKLVAKGRSATLECVAAFLIALSRQNVTEGRDPSVISDTLTCGLAAELLHLDIDTLGRSLVQLQRMGLINSAAGGNIFIISIGLLEALADGNGPPSSHRRSCEAASYSGAGNEIAPNA